jgi:acetyl-CoA C-acetyltransferase
MRSVIVAGARTPIAKFAGAYKDLSATKLGAVAIRAALERAGIEGEAVDYVMMGQVLQAGTGQITSRQAAVEAGVPKEVPAITLNKVCLSGSSAIAMADQMIRAGDASVVVAGGMESMTQAPYLIPSARFGSRLGDGKMVDSMIYDGLWSTFNDKHMGEGSDEVNAELGIAREEQDAWAARSHQRAAAAWDSGALAEEVVPVEIPQRKGDPVVFAQDDGIRADTTQETLSGLRPAFIKEGTITAGNASQLSDGAAATVIMSEAKAAELGLQPLAEIVSTGISADRFPYLHTVPALAIRRALDKADLSVGDLGLFEINEAFAAVAVNATKMLEVSQDIVNVNGGAVALGHPIGASGARIVLTLAYEMRRKGIDHGAAAICGGGGQGDAIVLSSSSTGTHRVTDPAGGSSF